MSALDEAVARTPQTRDRYVDFLRAASILVVVVGHWMIEIIWWQAGTIRTTSAIGVTSWLWLATWFLQVMPVFFFVGGFSNLVAYDAFRARGESTGAFVRNRVQRLLAPALVFIGVWVVVQVVLHVAKVARTMGAIAVDVVAFGFDHPGLRWLNVVFVLLLPHQLGHFYGDGRMLRWPRWAFAAMAAGGFAALLVLTNPPLFEVIGNHARFRWFQGLGSYPKSLLGTDVEPISNAYPPTVPFLAMAYWSIGMVMLLREPVTRWLRRPGPWKGTIVVNRVIMTLFLWHMTAYLLAILALWPLGFGREHDSSARWWAERPLWILVPGLILLGLIAVFGRFERPRPSGRRADA